MESIHNSSLDLFFKIITQFGGTKVILPLAIITLLHLIYKKRKREAVHFSLILVLGLIISEVTKFIVNRPRPLNALILETDPSFPSGHTLISTIFFILLIFLYKDKIKNKFLRILMISTCILLPILIGISRVYLNVHWLTDVLAGFVIALILVVISLTVKRKSRLY